MAAAQSHSYTIVMIAHHKAVFSLFFLLMACSWVSGQQALSLVNLEPYYFKSRNDSTLAELGTMPVPAVRSAPSSGRLELTFLRIKGPEDSFVSPIFFFEGGPGAPAIKRSRYELYTSLATIADVIVLDQRGTGMSLNGLECEASASYPMGVAITEELSIQLHEEVARDCKEELEARGIDLSAYTTKESAHDVRALQQVLGYDKINIVGMSYGSHLGLAVLRYFESSIDRAVLAGVEGYNNTYKLPEDLDHELRKIDDLAKAEFPDLYDFILETSNALAVTPVTVSISTDDGDREILITSFLFKSFVAGMIGRKEFISTIPSDFNPLKTGDYSGMATGTYHAYYRRGVGLNIMGTCMDCASGASGGRKARLAAQNDHWLADIANFPYPGICERLGVEELPEDFRTPLDCQVPTLFISGDLDGRTPLATVNEMRDEFEYAESIVVQNMGHDTNGLLLEAEGVMEHVKQFLRGKLPGDKQYSTSPIQFQ